MQIVTIFVIVLLIIGSVSWFFTIYNGLIHVKENIKKSWANIDVLLMQRSDEIPKLIKVLRSFVKHEKTMFDNNVIMITGGTGSFGNSVLKRFLDTAVKEIRIFSRDERKQEQMRINLANDKVKFYIGDVRNYDSLAEAMIGVDYIFHAAALKQVPSCEFYPMEAVRTNVIGTENVLSAAIYRGVKRVVFLSTDKAVYPINALGISKAMAEKLVIADGHVKTIFYK